MSNRTRDAFPLSKRRLRDNPKFRALTPSEKWHWLDLCLFLDDQDVPGISRWDLGRIARSLGAPLEVLRSLSTQEVLKGAHAGQQCEAFVHVDRWGKEHTLIPSQPGPIWYSSAIVRDEYLRAVASQSGRRGGGNPLLKAEGSTFIGASKGVVKGAPKGVAEGVSPAPSSLPVPLSLSSPTSPDLFLGEENPPPQGKAGRKPRDEIEEIYQAYPRKVGRGFARKAIANSLASLRRRSPVTERGETWASWLLGRVHAYAAARGRCVADDPSCVSFTPHPATWFNEGRYDDDPAEWEPKFRREKQHGKPKPDAAQRGEFRQSSSGIRLFGQTAAVAVAGGGGTDPATGGGGGSAEPAKTGS